MSMQDSSLSRRRFLKNACAVAGAGVAGTTGLNLSLAMSSVSAQETAADYALHIRNSAIEIAPKRIVSAVTYNGQFPGPLVRFKEGRPATVDIYNDTDTPEQLHWHGQRVPVDVDGAAEE